MKTATATNATLKVVPKSASADLRAWRQGADLALEMLDEASGQLDEMCLRSVDGRVNLRDGRPQRNLMLQYLRRLRVIADPRVETAFCAVMTEFVAIGCEGVAPVEFLRKQSRQPIATE